METRKLSECKPDSKNANRGRPRGDAMIERSLRQYGAGRSILLDKHGTIIAGNKTIKNAKAAGMEEVIIVPSDGRQLVAVQRTDLDLESDPRARELAIADNRTSEINLEWDDKMLSELAAEIDLSPFFEDAQLARLLGSAEAPETIRPESLKAATLNDLAPTPEEQTKLAGRAAIIQWSGGKDSSATAIWAKRYLPDVRIELVFVDMGADFIGFELFLHKFAAWIGFPLHVIRAPKTIFQVMLEHGTWPEWRHPYCQTECLYAPINEWLRARAPEQIVIIRGSRASERMKSGAGRMKSAERESRFRVVDDMPQYLYFEPVYHADKKTSETILAEAGAPRWSGYARGLCRTACRICPGQRASGYAAIRKNFPDVWQELLALEQKFGSAAWQAYDELSHLSFTEMADKGEEKFTKSGGR